MQSSQTVLELSDCSSGVKGQDFRSMQMTVNGEQKDVSSATVAELFEELEIPRRGRVVHVNGVFVHWTKYDTFRLGERDHILIIRGIAGG